MKSFSLAGLAQAIRWHRLGVGLLALFVAAVLALSALAPAQADGTPVVVAARPLSPGVALSDADLAIVHIAAELVPDGAFSNPAELVGRPLTVGLSRGTPITAAAMTPESLADHAAGEVLVPFRVNDPEVAGLLRLGDRLTIVAATPEGTMRTVAEHVRVAQLPAAGSGGLLSSGGTTSGALVVVAAAPDVARQLAAVGGQWLGVVIESGS